MKTSTKTLHKLKIIAQASTIIVLGVASIAAAGVALPEGTDARCGMTKASVEPCALTALQRQELAAIGAEVAVLEADREPSNLRIDGLLGRIDRLSRDSTQCLQPQIKSMISQAEGTAAMDVTSELRATALRLATDFSMSAEERNRLVAELQRNTQSLHAPDSATGRELQEQSAIFCRKLDGELGRTLEALDSAKRKLQRLRG